MIEARVYLSLGSNVGGREVAVLRAVNRIETSGVRVIHLSSLYETEPVGCDPMAAFVNAVAEIRTSLSPEDLMECLQSIEREAGLRGGHNRPRVLDIDVVTYGARVIRSASLEVPHPRYQDRAFVLVPLREIAPEFRCPRAGESVDVMLDRVAPAQAVSRISSRWNVVGSRETVSRRLEMQHG